MDDRSVKKIKRWRDRLIIISLTLIFITIGSCFLYAINLIRPVFVIVLGIIISIFTTILTVIFIYDTVELLKKEKHERVFKTIIHDGIRVAIGIVAAIIFFLVGK
jgi:hypothetical protein